MTSVSQLRRDLAYLKDGDGCWGITAGKGTGSMVSIQCGRKIRRSHPVNNPHLSEESRENEAEYCLFLRDCSWRLESDDEILSSSLSGNEEGGTMLAGLNRIVGQKIVDVRLNLPWMDLTIVFENGIRLKTFTLGETEPAEEFENFDYFVPGFVYAVSASGKLIREEREAG